MGSCGETEPVHPAPGLNNPEGPKVANTNRNQDRADEVAAALDRIAMTTVAIRLLATEAKAASKRVAEEARSPSTDDSSAQSAVRER